MESQVTTKRGDSGETTGLSGDAYSKAHPVMCCVGTVDELRAHIALLRLRIVEERPRDTETAGAFLWWLLHVLFLVGSACSDPLDKHPEYRKRDLSLEDLGRLEAEQERLERLTPLPHSFVVSAGNTLAAEADVACTVARRLERQFVGLREDVPEFESALAQQFLNRLSDYLYVLARHLDGERHETVDWGVLGT